MNDDGRVRRVRSIDSLDAEHRKLELDLAITTDALQNVHDLLAASRRRANVLQGEVQGLRRQNQMLENELAAIKAESALGLFVRKMFQLRRRTGVTPSAPRAWSPPRLGDVFLASGRWALRQYRSWRAPRVVLPRITLVTPVLDDAACDGNTLRSVHAQAYEHVDHVVATYGPQSDLDAAIRSTLDGANGEVFGIVRSGDTLEPGALRRVGEFFAAHPNVDVVSYQVVVDAGGLRFPGPAKPDTSSATFFRRRAYRPVGAATNSSPGDAGALMTHVLQGRAVVHQLGQVATHRLPSGEPYAPDPISAKDHLTFQLGGGPWPALERLERTVVAEYAPVCPATGTYPERLLFSAPITRAGSLQVASVYYVSQSHLAMTVVPPPAREMSARGCVNGNAVKLQAADPLPYQHYGSDALRARFGPIRKSFENEQRFEREDDWTDPTFSRIEGFLLASGVRSTDSVSFLAVGICNSELLGRASSFASWRVAGITATAPSVDEPAGGYELFIGDVERAPALLPLDRRFDVVWLDRPLGEFADPVATLVALRMLTLPGGRVLISTPNVDSAQIEMFGPTWSGWDPANSRYVFSARALSALGRLAGMRLGRLQTYSHPTTTLGSLLLNETGLGGDVPPEAPAEETRTLAVQIARWANAECDLKGKGDSIVAAFESGG